MFNWTERGRLIHRRLAGKSAQASRRRHAGPSTSITWPWISALRPCASSSAAQRPKIGRKASHCSTDLSQQCTLVTMASFMRRRASPIARVEYICPA